MQNTNSNAVKRLTAMMWGPRVAAQLEEGRKRAADIIQQDRAEPQGAAIWASNEVQYLRDNYPYADMDELQAGLAGRSSDTIQRKAARMGLKRGKTAEARQKSRVVMLIKQAREYIIEKNPDAALQALAQASAVMDRLEKRRGGSPGSAA